MTYIVFEQSNSLKFLTMISRKYVSSICTVAAPRSLITPDSPNVSGSAFTSQRVIKESVVADRPFVYVLYNVVNDIVFVAGKLEQPFWEEPVDEGLDSDIEAIKMS